MWKNAKTDLADEAREMWIEQEDSESSLTGVEAQADFSETGIRITRVSILDPDGAEKIGKPCGNYITMDIPKNGSLEQTVFEDACRVCAKELAKLIDDLGEGTVLVAGLGNRNITADAIGPKSIDSVLVTRHLLEYMPEEIDQRLRSVCAIAPGVLGLTGIETGEIIRGLAEKVKPSVIIVIDALCSGRMERINSTIQMSDTGITPGAGVGNKRMAINKETLGIPVIAVGVPTVVDAATIAGDTIDLIIADLQNSAKENLPLYKMLSVIAEEDKYSVIKQILDPGFGDFVVTPKEIDTFVERISEIIGNGINIALHEGITLQDINRYK